MLKRISLLILSGTLLVATASAQISIVGSLTRYQESTPGEQYEGVISLKNVGAATAQAKVYIQDYTFSADGKTGYLDAGSLPRSNAKWITLSASTAVLAPGEIADIKYSLDIPGSGTIAGTYWSIIFVEGIPEDAPVAESDVPTISIKQVMRYGIQIVSDFTAKAKSDLKFSNTKIVSTEAGRSFSVDLTNTGTRWLNGNLYIEVYNLDGDHVTTLSGSKFRTYPDTSIRKSISVAGIAPGYYKALLVADCGGDDLFGGNYNLVISE